MDRIHLSTDLLSRIAQNLPGFDRVDIIDDGQTATATIYVNGEPFVQKTYTQPAEPENNPFSGHGAEMRKRRAQRIALLDFLKGIEGVVVDE